VAKEKESKKVDLSQLSKEELTARLAETQDQYFRLRFRHASSPLKNPMELSEQRKTIARIKTYLSQKETVSK
jgi:large subunit ribosomal protein L29